jgi:hypothetical protein
MKPPINSLEKNFMDKSCFYSQHSWFSDPKEYKDLLKELAGSPEQLLAITQNLVVHEAECQWGNYIFAKGRYAEANLVTACEMLHKITELSTGALDVPRKLSEKLIVNCRGAALLFLTCLRSQAIPGRLRIGFISYHPIANFYIDHVIVEYLDPLSKQWRWADPLVTPAFLAKNPKAKNINPLNLKNTEFIPAQQAWLSIQCKQTAATDYGLGLFKHRRGLFAVRNKVLHEFSASLKHEMLPGDLWGYMLCDGPSIDPTDKKQLAQLDQMVDLLIQDNLAKINNYYQITPAIKVPAIVINHNAVDGMMVHEWGQV